LFYNYAKHFYHDYRRRSKQRTIFDNGTNEILINSGKIIACNGGENSLPNERDPKSNLSAATKFLKFLFCCTMKGTGTMKFLNPE
jgi:hypothetical protein